MSKYIRVKFEFLLECGDELKGLPFISPEEMVDAVIVPVKARVPEAKNILAGADLTIRRARKPREQPPRNFGEAMLRMHRRS